jgi:hypothetical protein
MPRKSRIPIPIQIEIINAYQDGRSARDVAADFNVHHSSVIDMNARIGAPVRPVGRPLKSGHRASAGRQRKHVP